MSYGWARAGGCGRSGGEAGGVRRPDHHNICLLGTIRQSEYVVTAMAKRLIYVSVAAPTLHAGVTCTDTGTCCAN